MARILVASDYFHPHWTGIVKSVVRLTRLLAKREEVTVVTVRHDPALPKRENIDGVRVIRARPLFRVSRAYYSLTAIWAFLRQLPRHDVVLINSPYTHVLACSLAARLFRRRLVIFHQGDLILAPAPWNRFVYAVFAWHTHIGMIFAQTVSTYSWDYARHSKVLRPFLGKLEPMLMPVEIATVPDPEGQVDDRFAGLERRRRSGQILFGFAGRFVEEKGFDVLLRAIPRVVERLPHAHFVFAGETEIFYEDFFERQQAALEEQHRHVTLLGLLTDEALARYYRLIDYFVLPSRSDCFALVQAEAALCGKPLVVADIPGARVLVQETGFGELFEPENAEQLAQAIFRVVERRRELDARHPSLQSFLASERILSRARQVLVGGSIDEIPHPGPPPDDSPASSVTR